MEYLYFLFYDWYKSNATRYIESSGPYIGTNIRDAVSKLNQLRYDINIVHGLNYVTTYEYRVHVFVDENDVVMREPYFQ
jgi:hypothetical protein